MNEPWERLARRYLAHREEDVLEQAAAAAPDTEIAALLRAFQRWDIAETNERAARLLESLQNAGRAEEALTVLLLPTDLQACLAELFLQSPIEQQMPALQEGLEACQRALLTAQALEDAPCAAFYYGLMGNGLASARQLEAARQAYEEARDIYQTLAEEHPQVYLSDVAMTLNNLGNVLRNLQEYRAARQAYEEAEALYRDLAETQPQVYLSNVAGTLNNLGTVLSDLQEYRAARQAYEEALTIRRRLAKEHPQVYLSDVAMTLNNLGNVLRNLQEYRAARQAFEEARDIYEGREQWLEAADIHYNLAQLERAEGRANGRTDAETREAVRPHYERCVECIYQGLDRLNEREHRDLFKKKVEPAYRWLIEDEARLVVADGQRSREPLAGWLESLRQVESVAGIGATGEADSEWRAAFRGLLRGEGPLHARFRTERCALLWVHVTENNVVFVALTPGACRVEVAARALWEKMGDLFLEVERALAYTGGRKSPLTDAIERNAPAAQIPILGEAAFRLLPEGVRELLAGEDYETIFLAPCAATIFLPFEMLRVPGGRTPGLPHDGYDDAYLGLRKMLPRVHGLAELARVYERQPDREPGRQALVAGNPLHHGFPHREETPCPVCKQDRCPVCADTNQCPAHENRCPVLPLCGDTAHCGAHPLPGARDMARYLEGRLMKRGFAVCALIEDHENKKQPPIATKEAVLRALCAERLALWAQNGHGARPDDVEGAEYLCLAGTDTLSPREVAHLNLPGTVVHHDCCVVGMARSRGGGRFDGHPTAALLAGASCVLSSVHALFDGPAVAFSAMLYGKALDGKQPLGAALLAACREMAAAHLDNPLFWGTTVLWGNPWARLA